MRYITALERRVAKLERLLFEGKKDQEVLNNFLGDDYYNKYVVIKNKIKDPDYKDIYKLIKKDPDEVKNFIDSIQSNTDVRRDKKSGGAKLIYSDDIWKVYRITSPEASQLYGSGTKWCITGRNPTADRPASFYFNSYINKHDLDGGYYFYIKNDGKTKYCILRKNDGEIDSIWAADDKELSDLGLAKKEKTFPTIPNVFTPPEIPKADKEVQKLCKAAFKGDIKTVIRQLNKGISPSSMDFYASTALGLAVQENHYDVVKLLLDAGADPNIADPRIGPMDRPLNIAKANKQYKKDGNYDDMISLLVEYGAN